MYAALDTSSSLHCLGCSSGNCEPTYADLAQHEEDRLAEEGFYWVEGMGWVEDEADEAIHLFASDTPLHDAHQSVLQDAWEREHQSDLELLPF